jgi:hypothetical protein
MNCRRKIRVGTRFNRDKKIAAEERQRLGLGSLPVTELSELLEAQGQGVRTAMVRLPDNISGLTLSDKTLGAFVVINADHSEQSPTFSLPLSALGKTRRGTTFGGDSLDSRWKPIVAKRLRAATSASWRPWSQCGETTFAPL